MGGTTPEHPVSIDELERLVSERIEDPRATAYVFGGAGREHTMRSNLEAFRRWRIVPRMLRDVSERDLSVTVLTTRMPAPAAAPACGRRWRGRLSGSSPSCARRPSWRWRAPPARSG